MITLNLLPWREKQRQKQAKNYYTLLGLSAFLSISVVLSLSMILHQRVTHETKIIHHVMNEEKALQPKLKRVRTLTQQREALLQKQQQVISFQKQNYQTIETLIQIGNQKRAGVTIQKITLEQGNLRIQGKTPSPTPVATYIQSLKELLDMAINLQAMQPPDFTIRLTPSATGEKS